MKTLLSTHDNRRQFIGQLAAGAAGLGLLPFSGSTARAQNSGGQSGFRYCLNTSTIRGQNLGIVGEVELAAATGFNAIEPWVNVIGEYRDAGGSLSDLKKRIEDLGITVESAIAFSQWIVDDPEERAKGLEQAKRDMDLVAQIGGTRIAAPPAGATQGGELNLIEAAARYRALLELGDEMGVIPELEVWGFSRNLHRLGQSLFVAVESGHPDACLLPDIYHVYRGGSTFEGLRLLGGQSIPVIHLNDYPSTPAREELNDSHRVYPGDGVAPWDFLIPTLKRINPNMILSLELFSRELWELPAREVAETGLRKMKQVVEQHG